MEEAENDRGRRLSKRGRKSRAVCFGFVFEQISDGGTQEKYFLPQLPGWPPLRLAELTKQSEEECRAASNAGRRCAENDAQVRFPCRCLRGGVFHAHPRQMLLRSTTQRQKVAAAPVCMTLWGVYLPRACSAGRVKVGFTSLRLDQS